MRLVSSVDYEVNLMINRRACTCTCICTPHPPHFRCTGTELSLSQFGALGRSPS